MATMISTLDDRQELLDLLPHQGSWTDKDYLWLTETTRRLVEFTDGYIEKLPMPTSKHQTILAFLFLALTTFLTPLGGKFYCAAFVCASGRANFASPICWR